MKPESRDRRFDPALGLATALVLMAAGAMAAPAAGQCRYEVTIVDSPPCPFSSSITGRGINELGHITGWYDHCSSNDERPFIWTSGPYATPLPFPWESFTGRAFDVDELGRVVGQVSIPDDGFQGLAFVHDGEKVTVLGTLPGGNKSVAHAINQRGQVVGQWGSSVRGPQLAFLWENGEMIDLGPLLPGMNSEAWDVSEDGVIVGWMGEAPHSAASAFLLEDGVAVALEMPPRARSSEAIAINERGQVAGNYLQDDPFDWRAFLWGDGQSIDLGTLPGHERHFVRGLNDLGQVVGIADRSPNTAFFWQKGVMRDLNELVENPPGLLKSAQAINSAGQILANVGGRGAVILTPIDRPITNLDGDCRTDGDDLARLLEDWARTDSPADFDGDGKVGFEDLLLLLANWD